ncbi:MAG: HAD family hydrolase [Candidatus Kerfeldbacteria bacterium]|nr:HAD family hydrolase [Candidatus Kerfeldbacteria bacterium]
MHHYVKNENLRRHMYACEAAMRFYATRYNGQSDEWGIAGLLHDFDWEIHPTLEQHPVAGQLLLAEQGVPEHLRRAILAHAEHTGVVPTTPLEKCLFAVDELTGFIVACALVQPTKQLADVTVESIKKKLKSKGFAAKVNRNDIAKGLLLIGLSEDEHFGNVLHAMQTIHEHLGL